MKKRNSLSIAALLTFFLSACSFSLAEDITPPPGLQQQVVESSPVPVSTEALFPLVAPDPENGEAIYAQSCAPCHGETGLGDGSQATELPNPPAPLGDPEFARSSSPAEWYSMVTRGDLDRFMPPFNSLTESQRWDVVAYSFSLSAPPEAMEEAGELFQANCASCHGEDGSGTQDGSDLTVLEQLAAQTSEDFYQIISKGQGSMPGFESELSETERWSLADYTRTLGFASSARMVAQVTPTPSEFGETVEEPGVETPEVETAQEIRSGIIRGQMVNQTGEDLPDDLVVTLHAFESMQLTGTYTTTISPDENFTFEDIEMSAGRIFVASTEYNGAMYGSDIVTVEEGVDEVSINIPIFGTLADTSVLTVDRLHLFFDFSIPETVQIIELYLISNPTDRTVVASEEGGPVLTFDLPEGATNLQFQDSVLGERYIETPEGFGDTEAVPPGIGQHQVLFAYEMPYKRSIDYEKKFDLPISDVVVLLPEIGVRVNSDMLEDAGTRDVEGEMYHMYNSGNIEPGTTFEVSLSGTPGGGSGLLSGSGTGLSIGGTVVPTSLIVGMLAIGVALIVAGILLYRNSKAKEEEIEDEEFLEEEAYEDETIDNLMDSIITLDDMYKEGELAEEAYRERRTELKERLRKLQEQG